ncbi:uncharacterized protein LOC132749603 [Ruditapes philippinarum]|uniref:uncharacterized protein LOC132749603 n=1 Tax=Ruditapes philippinarum TaxID=129788 RepID=UPI00295AEC6C|nr:uncharacterized protein LOC132749603 [Ruditapes philippinarum]
MTSATLGNLNVDDGFGKPGSLSIQRKSEDESMLLFAQDFCVHAALSHYVLAFMIVRFEYAKLQAVITAIACMEIPEGEGADEIISKRDIDEKDLLSGQEMMCSLTTYNDDRDLSGTYFDDSDIAKLSSMGMVDFKMISLWMISQMMIIIFRDSRDIDKTIRMFLNKEETATPVNTPSLSARKNDLSLFTLSPIKFIDRTFHVNLLNMVVSGSEVSGCEVSGSEVSGCNSFQALIGSSALGIPGSEMRKLYSPETLSTFQMKFTTENDHEDLSDEKVSAEIMNKTAK